MRAERTRGLRQLGIVHPDPARSAQLAASLDQRAIALLLLRRHLLIGDLGITAKGWRIGHFQFPSQGGLVAHPATAAPTLSTPSGRDPDLHPESSVDIFIWN